MGGEVTLGGRRVPISRPRVRTADDTEEVGLASYAEFESRDLLEHLPERERPWVRSKLRLAWADPDHTQAFAALRALARTHPDAAGSLREGLEETLTLKRLGVPGALKRTLCSTNPIESMIGTVRDTQRNVKRWRGGDMRLRWTAAGLAEEQKSFRRVKGHSDISKLTAAIRHEHNPTPTKEAAAHAA